MCSSEGRIASSDMKIFKIHISQLFNPSVVNWYFLCHFPDYVRRKYDHKNDPFTQGKLAGERDQTRGSQERKDIKESVRRLISLN